MAPGRQNLVPSSDVNLERTRISAERDFIEARTFQDQIVSFLETRVLFLFKTMLKGFLKTSKGTKVFGV